MEEWRTAAGFPWYEVSSLGRVRRVVSLPYKPVHGDGILAPTVSGPERNYPAVNLSREGRKQSPITTHRLVALTFLGPPPTARHQVNHIDGDTFNPRLENLEWVTPSENQRHAARLGLSHPGINSPRGERHHSARVTADQVREIRSLGGSMSQFAIAERYGIKQPTVSEILRRTTWKDLD